MDKKLEQFMSGMVNKAEIRKQLKPKKLYRVSEYSDQGGTVEDNYQHLYTRSNLSPEQVIEELDGIAGLPRLRKGGSSRIATGSGMLIISRVA